jgi:four helix bundle protein
MAKNYKELIVWQLGFQLRRQIVRMTKKRRIEDRDFVWDIRRAAKAVAANTAEGHGRFLPADNHHFLVIAKSSLDETEGHLKDGLENGDFDREDWEVAHNLVKRLTVAMTRLMNYLRSQQAKDNAARHRRAIKWTPR